MAPHRPGRIERLVALSVCGLVGIAPAIARGQDGAGGDRRYHLLRDQERWAWLRKGPGPSASADVWDPVKYVRLDRQRDDVYLTLGGEMRQWVEGYHHELWGATPYEKNAYWLQRYMLHVHVQATPHVRAFAEAKSGIEAFRQGGARPVDEDRFDFNQLFLDAVAVPGATLDAEPRLLVRSGRQEMSYGSGRFIDVREGPNVRFGYDGVRLLTRAGALRFDAFGVRPAETKPGALDDGFNHAERFWGAWSTLDLPALLVDAYYLGHQRERAKYQKASGMEHRHTGGARVRARMGAIDIEVEAAGQLGTLGAIPIRAWTIATEAVARPARLPFAPVVTLGLGVTSGDGGARDRALGTFSPLFPRGTYFGLVSANGPSNDISPHAAVALSLPASVTFTVEGWCFWRESAEDGVYSVPGNLLRPGAAGQGRFLGVQVEGFLAWQIDRHLSLNATYAHFWTGDFFSNNAPGKAIDYAAGWATYKF